MNNNLNEIYEILKKDIRLVNEEGELLKNKIQEFTLKADADFISLLLNNKMTKDMFFIEVNGIFVFDKSKFAWMIDSKDFLPDSYTAYYNKIMLTDEKGNSIRKSDNVVLSFPFKDCVLEGGQVKDDEERKEIFYNEILGKDDIDTLLAPKVLVNSVKYTKGNKEKILNISDEDNILIKGNNLIALSTLKKRYSNKIKMAFWDVPYNTGSDSFRYNDSFKRTTWLTFIKNRVEQVLPLLKDDGVFLLQCSFHQYAYVKVLLDEIIGNYLMTFNVLVRHPDRVLTGDKEFNDVIEYILVYSKSSNYKMPKKKIAKSVDEYIYQVKIKGEGKKVNFGEKEAIMYLPEEYDLIKTQPSGENLKILTVRGSIKEKNSSGRFYMKYLNPIEDKYPAKTLFKVDNIGDDIYPYRYFYLPPKGNKNGAYLQGMPTSSKVTLKPYPNFIDFVQSYNVVNSEGEVEFRNGKKPEDLISFLMDIFTQENDFVIDAFMGSGTTGVVALKKNRKFIGIEQMDYINDITINRLINTINGDKTGISEEENWKGGGSFIYSELANNSEEFIEKIKKSSESELLNLFEQLKESDFVSYRLDINELEKEKDGFLALSEDEKRKLLINIIDKNTLYINYSEINDNSYNISDDIKQFNNSFYKNEV